MTLSDYKLQVLKEIMLIENEHAIKQIHAFVHTFYSELQNISRVTSKNTSEFLSFEEWNKQFSDNQSLDDFIPEYGSTLREFRQKIYEAEKGEEMSMQEFKHSLKSW